MPDKRLRFSRIPCLVGAAALLHAVATATHSLGAQAPTQPLSADQSAAEVHRLVSGLTVTPRVLLIGMHPDDQDTQLITWLTRGQHVETGYLSITRGEAGQNFGGVEAGTSLGAIRTQELLASRRIDGAHQFFTRAFDFGAARDTADVLKHWTRDSIVGDIVAVIRAFRPHVIIAMVRDSVPDGDGQRQALGMFVADAFTASADAAHFRVSTFGYPWPVAKWYRYGMGMRIETSGYDHVLGKTFADVALESRAQHRSQGLLELLAPRAASIELRRMGSRVGDSTSVDESLFSAIDTSFARLGTALPPEARSNVATVAANADSARQALDLNTGSAAAVPFLVRVVTSARRMRAAVPWCHHPGAAADPPAAAPANCDAKSLDLEASVDLVRDRSIAALLAAAGVSFTLTADRELLASNDTADVTLTMVNRGAARAVLEAVDIRGSHLARIEPIFVLPDSTVRSVSRVTNLADAKPWWSGPHGGPTRGGDRFEDVPSSVDGIERGGMIPGPFVSPSVAVPEDIRRTSGGSVTVVVGGVAFPVDLGPVIYRHADPVVGLQNRTLGGIPDVTFQFSRGLEWIPRNKPFMRSMRVAVKSHSDRAQDVGLQILSPLGMPKGIRVDSLPLSLQLAPHEERELLVQLRGKPTETDRLPLGIVGRPRAATPEQNVRALRTQYQTGLQTVQRDYLPPIHLMPASGEWMQPIDIDSPPTLTVLYVPGVNDDIASALRQVGIWVSETASADQLLSVDLSKVTTIAIGARALDAHPEFLGQTGRLLDFVRKGGTLVVLRGEANTATSGLFPYPVTLARPTAENVLDPTARVTVLDAAARTLNWPNKIGPADWLEWSGSRAQSMPTTADARYTRMLEVHDADQSENRNAILTARVGKGLFIYTTLTLDRQIAAGIPGGLRLFVNMLSAGIPSAR